MELDLYDSDASMTIMGMTSSFPYTSYDGHAAYLRGELPSPFQGLQMKQAVNSSSFAYNLWPWLSPALSPSPLVFFKALDLVSLLILSISKHVKFDQEVFRRGKNL